MQLRTRIIIASVIGVIGAGTVFFRFVEGWSWLDAYFFTVVTISTVGYGELVPATAIGKIGTTVLIFTGLGVFAVAIQQFAEYHVKRRTHRGLHLFGRNHEPDPETEPANEDQKPD